MRIKRNAFYICFIASTFLPVSLFSFQKVEANIQNIEEIAPKQKTKNYFKIKKQQI